MKPRLQKRRLAKLLNYSRKIKPKEFDMGEWCGTAQCLGGHSACVPSFNRAGLGVSEHNYIQLVRPRKNTLFFSSALREFFGLTPDERDYLFYTDTCSTGRDGLRRARNRIRNVIDGKFRQRKQAA